jgi:Asp-tRNA(Asn)/Glu-tRNA(Gln) amidotransferase C subunit
VPAGDAEGAADFHAEVLAAAPSVEDERFRVPPVLGESP